MGTHPLRWTSGHSRQEKQTSMAKTQVQYSYKMLTSKVMDTYPPRQTHIHSDRHSSTQMDTCSLQAGEADL